MCVCVSRLQCVYVQEKERKIGTDCVQHLSSVDPTTKERARQHGQHQTGRVRSRKEARNERQGCSGRRRASEEKRKTLTHKNRLRKIKDTGGKFPPMFRVEDDICSPKNKVCSVSVCLYPSARYVYLRALHAIFSDWLGRAMCHRRREYDWLCQNPVGFCRRQSLS